LAALKTSRVLCGLGAPPTSPHLVPLHHHQSTNMAAPSRFQTLGTVVVVGGCGFLGSHIVLDLRTNSNRHTSSTVSYHDGDITDLAAMQEFFARIKPDAVIHTASPHFNLPPAIHDKVNVQGTKNLLKASQDAGVKAFVYTSSASVIFGGTTELVNANEEWPLVTGDAQPEYYTTTKVRTN
jgi:sterol-4alpha-carboxylate 3-dehydrogenase (decarboxylating)